MKLLSALLLVAQLAAMESNQLNRKRELKKSSNFSTLEGQGIFNGHNIMIILNKGSIEVQSLNSNTPQRKL